jgi:hypothetical protein
MVYVLIALGLAVVIGPLISAMPSKAQRRVAAVRDRAKELGLARHTAAGARRACALSV